MALRISARNRLKSNDDLRLGLLVEPPFDSKISDLLKNKEKLIFFFQKEKRFFTLLRFCQTSITVGRAVTDASVCEV